MTEDLRPALLIIGASVLQLPAIERARKLGYRVGVLDRDPHAPGVTLADVFYEVSTIDAEGVSVAAAEFAPDGIVTIGTDMPMRALAQAAASLGLPAPRVEAVFAATDKSLMAARLHQGGVPAPRTGTARSEEEFAVLTASWVLPVIVKPADSSGSRGVTKVESTDALEGAFLHAAAHSHTGVVIVQDFMRGREVSVEGFCIGAEPTIVAITDKLTTGAPHFVEIGHSQPTTLTGEQQEDVRSVTMAAARALGLSDCALHAELIVTAEGAKVVEVGARLGGDFITSHLVSLSTGVDMIAALFEIAQGRPPILDHIHSVGSAVRFLDALADPRRVAEAERLEGVVSAQIRVIDTQQAIRSSTDRLGQVIATGATARDAVEAAEHGVRILLDDSSVPIGTTKGGHNG